MPRYGPPRSGKPMHFTQIALKWFEFGWDCDAWDLRVQRQSLVSLSLPHVLVEGYDLVPEVRPRGGDSVPRQGEALRMHAPAVHGRPKLVRRERRDRGEEPHEVPQACVERPPGTRVPFVGAGLDHLDVVRREQVPEELPASVRGLEQVQILVGAAARFDEPVQLREDPFVRGLELPRIRLVEGGDEPGDVPELRHELADCVGPVFLNQRPGVDYVSDRAVHSVPARIEAEAVDVLPLKRLRPP